MKKDCLQYKLYETLEQENNITLKTLSRQASVKAMEDWINRHPKLPNVNKMERRLREDLEKIFDKIKTRCPEGIPRRNYLMDIKMGLALYKYLDTIPDFNMRYASDEGFWRYLSLVIAPHLVAERWDFKNEDHYWKKPTRVWLRSVWWYVYLSWQGSFEATEDLLKKECFDTDTLKSLEERAGRNGTFIKVSRIIMKFFAQIPEEGMTSSQETMFRTIMKLNTAMMVVNEPGLCNGGEEGYVKLIFKNAGIKL